MSRLLLSVFNKYSNNHIFLSKAEGVYGFKPPLPAIGGNEGVAVVTEV